ncbi:hypothetical protein CEXT_506691 [Caerostris extrusa]|uniref:Uncharacterized protein n=1 Tax=Caerostris extrusa TaxID=172846 RepID=A0AAV4W7M5_CAEEX|nr:hypothetical protein CEXT_506691 [Caerostris extrusa]
MLEWEQHFKGLKKQMKINTCFILHLFLLLPLFTSCAQRKGDLSVQIRSKDIRTKVFGSVSLVEFRVDFVSLHTLHDDLAAATVYKNLKFCHAVTKF